jgi:branched-chain amino acid aminotransferase
MGNDPKFIWMDGELVETAKATIPFLTSGLHYGAGVFEGIRCYQTDQGPAIFRNAEHMERLVDSAAVLGFRSLPFTVDELRAAAKQLVKVNGYGDCYLRPLIYAAAPLPSLKLDENVAKIGMAAWEWGAYLGEEAREKGVRANVSSFTRHHPNVSMTKAKITGNYANSILAKTESVRLGFDEAILLDPQGYVAECSGENLFVVRRGAIYTTATAPILEGITRDAILLLAQDLGYPVREGPISRDQLYIADEVFICGTAAEVVAVREIDFRTIGIGKMGPVTKTFQDTFHAAVRGNHPRSAGWLDYV